MIIPVRCFTCNKVIGHLWGRYTELVSEYLAAGEPELTAHNKALNEVGLPPEKYCCRRMLLSHVNVIDQLLRYSNNPGEGAAPKYSVAPLPENYEEDLPDEIEDDEDDDEDMDDEAEEEDDGVEYEELSDDEDKDYAYIDDDA